jgi:hypothetical protein
MVELAALRTRLTPGTAALILAPLLFLAAAGCTDERFGVGAGVRPLALVDRTSLAGNLVQDDPGVEVTFTGGDGTGSLGWSLLYIPTRNTESAERAELFAAEFGHRVRWDDGDPGPFLLLGAGWGVAFMDFEDGADFAGLGPSMQIGTGITNQHLHVDVFWENRAWLGADSGGFRAAWATGLGAALSLSF